MIHVRSLGLQPYIPVWQDMKTFTASRSNNTEDELWLLEHLPVYTQGQTGKKEHILNPGTIPIIQTDRGGQVTYHGPGQLVAYVLMDIRRRAMGIRTLVCQLERTLMQFLLHFDIRAETCQGAPGVYVDNKKIASVGLRVKNGCTYHGIALNVAMDLTPFAGINPCGYEKLAMTQIQDAKPDIHMNEVIEQFIHYFFTVFGV